MGAPKQLAEVGERTLLHRAVDVAKQSGAREVIVVLGAQAEAIREKLRDCAARIVVNEDWREGMSTSIRVGVKALAPGCQGAVIMTCDQPSVTSLHLRKLALGLTDETPITASSYEGVAGVPAAFSKPIFVEVLSLRGDIGARDLIRSDRSRVKLVPLAGGEQDIDEPSDLTRDS